MLVQKQGFNTWSSKPFLSAVSLCKASCAACTSCTALWVTTVSSSVLAVRAVCSTAISGSRSCTAADLSALSSSSLNKGSYVPAMTSIWTLCAARTSYTAYGGNLCMMGLASGDQDHSDPRTNCTSSASGDHEAHHRCCPTGNWNLLLIDCHQKVGTGLT